jgi:hypothetical protein
MLGKILRTTFFPEKSFNETSLKSDFVSLKSGAAAPTLGKLPTVLTGFPLNVTFAMMGSP